MIRCWACNSEVQVPSEVQEPRELGSRRLQKLPEASRRLQNLHKLPEASKTCRRCKSPHKAQQPSEAGRALVLVWAGRHRLGTRQIEVPEVPKVPEVPEVPKVPEVPGGPRPWQTALSKRRATRPGPKGWQGGPSQNEFNAV